MLNKVEKRLLEECKEYIKSRLEHLDIYIEQIKRQTSFRKSMLENFQEIVLLTINEIRAIYNKLMLSFVDRLKGCDKWKIVNNLVSEFVEYDIKIYVPRKDFSILMDAYLYVKKK